jgi:hypothetical protein
MGIKYEIVRAPEHETDLGGSWCVSLFGDRVEMAGNALGPGFQEAIGSDGPYYQDLRRRPSSPPTTFRRIESFALSFRL